MKEIIINPYDYSEEKEWKKTVLTLGSKYIKTEEYIVKKVSEPTEVEPDTLASLYSDGTAPKRVVQPGGFVLFDGKKRYPISEEVLESKYIPCKDENGEKIPDTYLKKTFITAYKIPANMKVFKTNGCGTPIQEYDENDFIAISEFDRLVFYTGSYINGNYIPYNEEEFTSKHAKR